MAVVVHGVVTTPTSEPFDPDGLDRAADRPVRLLQAGDVTALVTDVDGEVLPSRANLLSHTRLLEHTGALRTVLPMRFGVVAPDDEQLVATYLQPRAEALGATLARLRDRAELRLSATYDEDLVVQAVVDDDPRLARLRGRDDVDTRMRLGEGIAQGIEARRLADGEAIVAELGPYADDLASSELTGALDVLAVSFLVATNATAAFEDAVERVGERFAPTVAMELIGPMPAFSFAQEG